MNGPVDRFRKKRAALADTDLSAQYSVHPALLSGAESASSCGLPAIVPAKDVNQAFVAVDADALLAEIHGKLDSEKIGALIDACQKECLQAVIRPFGLARVLFQDKDGGNVDTVHNARNNVYATAAEREKYDDHQKKNPYNEAKDEYHGDQRYKDSNRASSATQKAGGVVDEYTGKIIGPRDTKHQDHVVSAKEVHDDRGRVLAEVDGVTLANSQTNLKATSGTINSSKQARTADEFIRYVEDVKIPNLKAKIAKIEGKTSPTPEDLQKLAKLRRDLDEFKVLNKEKLRAVDAAARKEINGQINKAYYTSKKFLKNTAATSATEGGRMALQQAVGVLMEEFVSAAFAEVRDVWHNGFRGKVDDAFLDVLKLRLMRVADRVQAKWKDAAVAFRDGFISGFLSNLVTVAINAFVTTSARWVRITREGFMSLYRAMKTLAFPPEGMSLAEAADAASKLMAAGIVTGGGILLEEVVEKALAGALGPLAPYVSAIAVGVATGLCTVFAVYMLDRLDLFGVNAKTRHAQVVAKLDETISLSYNRALEAASAFDPPSLPHLA